MNGGSHAELNVSLRLLLDKIAGDAQRATALIKKQFSGITSTGAASAVKAQNKELKENLKLLQQVITAEQKRIQNIQAESRAVVTGIGKRTRSRFKGFSSEGLTNTGSGLATPLPNIPTGDEESKARKEKENDRIADAVASLRIRRQKQQLHSEQDSLKFYKDMSLLMLPLLKPGSVWGQAFASRAVSSGLLGTAKGRSAMGAFGLSGASGALKATGILIAGATVAGFALKALAFTIKDLAVKSVENARQIYSKSLTRGLSIGFVNRRKMLADVIGVDEKDLFQFGAAIAFVGDKLDVANREIVATTPTLAAMAMNFKILKANLMALGAQIAAALAPAINRLTALASALTKLSVLAGEGTILGAILGIVVEMFTRLAAVLTIFPALVLAVDTAMIEGIKYVLAQINNAIADTKIGQMLGFKKKEAPGFDKTRDAFGALGDVLKAAFGAVTKTEAPKPSSYMKQLGASSLERMGLVMGIGGGNPAQETAKNTKQTVVTLNHILTKMTGKQNNPMTFSPAQAHL